MLIKNNSDPIIIAVFIKKAMSIMLKQEDSLINEVIIDGGSSIIDRDPEASRMYYQASDICWEEAHSKLPPEGYETNSHNRTNFFEQCMLDAGYTFHPKGISGKAKSSCYQLQRNSPACNSVPFSREIR